MQIYISHYSYANLKISPHSYVGLHMSHDTHTQIKMCHIEKKKNMSYRHMGWLRLVGSLSLYVSFAEYGLFCRALQKRPIILRSLLIVATPYSDLYTYPIIRSPSFSRLLKIIGLFCRI